jgi:hypothetical protein
MHEDAFQGSSPVMCAEIFNQAKHNVITEEYTIICNAFEYIEQTVNSVDRPNDRNQALCGVDLLFDSFWNLISGYISR